MSSERLVLGRLQPGAVTGFERGSAIRRISSEPCIGLLLQRALVMEVAHAKVGAGVQHHSLFRDQPYRRFLSTMDVALRLVWGGDQVGRRAAQQVYRFHDHVNGELPEPNAAWPQGDHYTAHDASLLLWVWATLVDTTECAFERWVRPLGPEERNGYYRDMTSFATFFGIPASMVPADRDAFGDYYESVIDGDELTPTPTSAAMIRDVLWYRHWNVPAAAVRPLRVLSIGTLDPRIRDRFDLQLSAEDDRLFKRLDGLLARGYRHRPAWLFRRLPEIYVALRGPTIGLSSHSIRGTSAHRRSSS